MKVIVATTPIRPVPTLYPPYASMAITRYMRENGYEDTEFYNIDSNRPSFEETIAHIVASKPDVLGISAVVSTAYEYTKRLALAVKSACPETIIVVGGNLAASSEVLLRMAGVDLCVVGEGEKVFHDIARRAETTRNITEFIDIPGLVVLDKDGNLINTGYPTALGKDEIFDVDWGILEESSDINLFVADLRDHQDLTAKFTHDPRFASRQKLGQRFVLLPASKGCVAKCTFCHRWDKGIRYVPSNLVIDRIIELRDRFNVGFLSIADENFGTDRRWLKDFCAQIKSLDMLWWVAGMRVNCISPEQITMMKDAGCIGILYGMETGSAKILQIMEKKTTVEDNINAMRWTVGAGVATVVQLVLGMPGESPETVSETIQFCQTAMTLDKNQNPNELSINYAQALPGTPLYEYGRHKELIGQTLEDEEGYLLSISDKDAHDEITTVNFTDYPALEHQSWRPRITIETNYAFVRKYGIEQYLRNLMGDGRFFEQEIDDRGYFANPKRLVDTGMTTNSIHGVREKHTIDNAAPKVPGLWALISTNQFGLAMICHPMLFYRLRHFLPLLVFAKNLSRVPLAYNIKSLHQYLLFKLGLTRVASRFSHEYKSLRKIVNEDLGALVSDDVAMAPLRKGR
jgi:anaerobic magnesium-protoporphyrin IX monomethyl ester cyclase